ncbi:MAG: 2-polyprenyl-3-methyl-6-methoxy-1,4-benzoquinone monooxygenase [Rhodocyclaceae bacterium]|nr:2-polyprenyl-3-methyl-6-methoxy-1,4-benzoquinone monooxygenase [Rhodocyclaceae bacterium]
MKKTLCDVLIDQFDRALRTLCAPAKSRRATPGSALPEADLSPAERRHAAALMRINHVGEVCAQALYASQALYARDERTRQALTAAAEEEVEHLAWTEQRIAELGGRTSLFNPLWYLGAWTIGAIAGRFGDAASLGFVVETERQVEAHLAGHEASLPPQDQRSRAIVAQMKADEVRHAENALRLGGASLPEPVPSLMRLAAKLMTRTAYYL